LGEESRMTKLEISLFHRLNVCDGSAHVSVSARKAQELLCYLVLFRDRAHTREFLAETLWADSGPKQSRSNLRKALWHLRSTMCMDNSGAAHELLLVGPEWIRIHQDAYEAVEGVMGAELSDQQVRQLRNAVELYRGDLLEGWYQDWCLHERQRFQFMYLAMLDKLIGYAETNGEYDVGIGYCARVLRHDWARERTHRQLMRLYYLAGDRNAALEQYDHCVRALREDLDVGPDARTTKLYQEIRCQAVSVAAPYLTLEAAAPEAELAELLQRLREHRDALAEIHRMIDTEISRINALVHTHQIGR
jgi:DNA-binding SARP family transcriptional activator